MITVIFTLLSELVTYEYQHDYANLACVKYIHWKPRARCQNESRCPINRVLRGVLVWAYDGPLARLKTKVITLPCLRRGRWHLRYLSDREQHDLTIDQ